MVVTGPNAKDVEGIALAEAVNVMRGRPGTDGPLTIVRNEGTSPLEFTPGSEVI